MDIADLQLIDAVASRGSFTAAAAQLRLSQPAVSARVSAVERAVGASLFTRDSRGARLTPAGQRYLGYVRRCLHLLADGARAAAAERPDPNWTVGVPASYAPALAPILTAAAADCEWPLAIRADHSTALRVQLLDGRLDIAIATPGPLPTGSRAGTSSTHPSSPSPAAPTAASRTAATPYTAGTMAPMPSSATYSGGASPAHTSASSPPPPQRSPWPYTTTMWRSSPGSPPGPNSPPAS